MSSYVKVRTRSRQACVKESGLGVRKGESIRIFLEGQAQGNGGFVSEVWGWCQPILRL
jgi:hypothetical protein